MNKEDKINVILTTIIIILSLTLVTLGITYLKFDKKLIENRKEYFEFIEKKYPDKNK